ncbi:MAG: SAM hydrolase/SAM-dependent halogenase family protein [Nitrososphaeria archaeon]
MGRRVVALLTDFGEGSIYVGEMKGVLLKINPEADLVDLAHNVRRHDVVQGAFLLREAHRFFPESCIFLCVIDPGVGTRRGAVIVQTEEYFFVGPDNGLLYPSAQMSSRKHVVKIENPKYLPRNISSTFHGRDIFAAVAAYLSKGVEVDEFGPPTDSLCRLEIPNPVFGRKSILARVLFVDSFGNVVTNVREDDLPKASSLTLSLGKSSHKLPIVKSYSDVEEGMPLTLFDSFGLLEISVNKGDASQYFCIREGSKVKIMLPEGVYHA